MKKKFSIIILAGGFGTSLQILYPSIPKALVPLGHVPSLCIQIETLLELDNLIDNIYVLVFKRHLYSFEKEINRWFYNNEKIKIISLPDCQGTAKSIDFFLQQKDLMNEHIIIIYSNIPLISKFTLKDFLIHCTNQEQDLIAIVAKLKKKKEYDYAIINNNEDLVKINSQDVSEFYFLNVFYIEKKILNLIPKIKPDENTKEYNINEIVGLYEGKKGIYILNPYIANKECIIINKLEDKNFAEEIYLENRNANFIHQCYGLWRQCEQFENRLYYIEKILEKNSIS